MLKDESAESIKVQSSECTDSSGAECKVCQYEVQSVEMRRVNVRGAECSAKSLECCVWCKRFGVQIVEVRV